MNATPRTAVPGRRPENRQGTNRVARAGLEPHAVDGSRPSSGVLPGSCGADLHLSGATALEGTNRRLLCFRNRTSECLFILPICACRS
jgi:hypothetical protein